MFVNAIEKVGGFTRPVFTISRKYGEDQVEPGASTIFFVNDEGWAVTCKHVAALIINAGKIEKKYSEFKQKRAQIPAGDNFEDELRQLAEEYEFDPYSVAQMKVNFVDCVDRIESVKCRMHPRLDLALIKFEGFSKTAYKETAVFADDNYKIKQGRFLCRLGFPFPEFSNFRYDADKDDIVWTSGGTKSSPRFPIEGMVTRLIGDNDGVNGIEISTPGFEGHRGGPLFDTMGVICGMQSAISNHNLGRCIHVNSIKEFMRKEDVSFTETGGAAVGLNTSETEKGKIN